MCPELIDKVNSFDVRILRDMLEIEGLVSHNSKHAAGIIIAPEPIYNFVPCTRDSEDHTMMLCQYDKKIVEEIGLYKFDLLGLKLLTIFDMTIKNIYKNTGVKITLKELFRKTNLNDKAIYDCINTGDMWGLFQFEGQSAKEVVLQVKPQNFNDLMACESICRPGVKEAELYISNKRLFDESGTYPAPTYWDKVKHILEETYGAIVYQEQTMRIFADIGGYTLGEADRLRKAKSLEPERERFTSNAIQNGFTSDEANELFDRFSLEYAFNKSHAGVYGVNTAVCAYLKTNYRKEFMAAVMSLELTKGEPEVVSIIKECIKYNVEILPPDINISTDMFGLVQDKIIMPITLIGGVGDSAVKHLNEIRPFGSFEDFLNKVQKKKCNSTSIKKLIKCGAFNKFNKNRTQLLEVFNEYNSEDCKYPFYCDEVQIAYEVETLGMSLTKHPLDGYINTNISDLSVGTVSSINAIINEVRVIKDKNQNEMAFVKCENKACLFEAVIFARQYQRVKHLLQERMKVIISGKIEVNKILVDKMEVL